MTDTWQDGIKSQQRTLEQLKAADAALNQEQIAADIDKMLTQPYGYRANPLSKNSNRRSISAAGPIVAEKDNAEDMADIYGQEPSMSSFYIQKGVNNPLMAPAPNQQTTPQQTAPKQRPSNIPAPSPAPTSAAVHASPASPPSAALQELTAETADRFSKAKITMLNKKLADATEIRETMETEIADLRKQLRTVREENKSLNSRIQSLESEIRRANNTGRRGGPDSARDQAAENMDREALKRDLVTAERLAKQANEAAKNKDTQLKRAVETIARLKSQLDESMSTKQTVQNVDQAKVQTLENRVRTLEKQRSDLVEGFRKQMKLIDVLKRQKIHLEAARLLAFTEEEFMKTLDWKS